MVLSLAFAGLSFAQESAVKEAKSIANGTNPDFDKAEQIIAGALTNDETKNSAEAWNVAGFIQKRRYDKEQEKVFLKQEYDNDVLYNSVLGMCKYYLVCDELAQVPDEKGKIKNKYRKANAESILSDKDNLINGGIYYFNLATTADEAQANEYNKKAADFFTMYVDVTYAPMLEDKNLAATDTLLGQIAYYACLAAYKIGDYEIPVKYGPYGKNDPEVGMYAMEFYCGALKELGRTDEFLAALQEGMKLYPDHSYFFGNLIDYYSNNDKNDEALAFAAEMLASNPENPFYLYVMAYLYHSGNDYDNALTYYQKTIAVDPSYADAYSNIGLIYCQKAQDFSEQATSDVSDPQYQEDQKTLRAFYESARPYYEKARELKPEQQELWLQGLYRVYYNLDMGDEFKEIESLMM